MATHAAESATHSHFQVYYEQDCSVAGAFRRPQPRDLGESGKPGCGYKNSEELPEQEPGISPVVSQAGCFCRRVRDIITNPRRLLIRKAGGAYFRARSPHNLVSSAFVNAASPSRSHNLLTTDKCINFHPPPNRCTFYVYAN